MNTMVSRNLRFRFTLVSYNILSQTLLNDHSHLYNNCSPHDLEWPRRGHKIVKELMNDRADIICLQEVESEHLQSLYRPRLAHYGYECLYKKKTGYKIDGCAIFYKSKLFHLLSHKGIEFNRTDVAHLLNRDNVGIIAVLKPRISTKSESSHLVIANTHLIFNPNRSDIKLAQLKFFLSELEAISTIQNCDTTATSDNPPVTTIDATSDSPTGSRKREFHPTILCGDLNSTPNSEVSRYILKNTSERHRQRVSNGEDDHPTNDDRPATHRNGQGHSTPEGTVDTSSANGIDSRENPSHAKLNDSSSRPSSPSSSPQRCNLRDFDHSLEFKSVYPAHNKAGQRYVSTFSSDIVDYIFYTPRLRVESFKELLTEEQLENIGSLPNTDFPSDHIVLGAKFTLK